LRTDTGAALCHRILKPPAGFADLPSAMVVFSDWVLSLGKLFFVAGGIVASIVLLRAAPAGGRRWPHLLAAAAIVVGGIGLALYPVALRLPDSVAGYSLWIAGEILMRSGIALLGIFLWRVFRPRSRAALAGAVGCAALLTATLVWDLTAQQCWWLYDGACASAYMAQLALAVPFVWSAVETGLEWRRSRRRVALGLADLQVSHRFLLWCVATSAFVAICLLHSLIAWLGANAQVELAAGARLVRGLLYFVIVGALWLGLTPPAFYRRRIQANPTLV
jgi:hypothetical protein